MTFEELTRKHRCPNCTGRMQAQPVEQPVEPEPVRPWELLAGTIVFLTLFLGAPFVVLLWGTP